MKRTVSRLLDLAVAIGLSLAIANIAQVRVPAPSHVRDRATLGRAPTVSSDLSLMQIDARRHRLML